MYILGVYETVWNYPHVIVNLPNFKVNVTVLLLILLNAQENCKTT